MPLPDLPVLGWVVVVVSAVVVGVAKTSVGGIGAAAMAGFAMFLPAKESTAAVLLVLIVGDVVAVSLYGRHTDWQMLRRLLPAVVPGIVLGALVMRVVDNTTMILIIAGVILAALALQVGMRWRRSALLRREPAVATVAGAPAPAPSASAPSANPSTPSHPQPHLAAAVGAGVAGGFATMVANAAGPVMALYLLAARVDKVRFVATGAWFFFIVNLVKVPFSAALGLFPVTTLGLTVVLVPAVLVGTLLGRRLLRVLGQAQFERITMAMTLVAGVVLLLRAAG